MDLPRKIMMCMELLPGIDILERKRMASDKHRTICESTLNRKGKQIPGDHTASALIHWAIAIEKNSSPLKAK
jgi:hypothetical protein